MDLALHDPRHGYYAANLTTVGTRGDFSTSATISDLPAHAIAQWLTNCEARHVIEIGAGGGQLAKALLARTRPPGLLGLLPRQHPLRYHLVESSPVLREAQRQLLGRSATWHPSVAEALDACDGNACLFSNELVDAFPVRVFRRGGSFQAPSLSSQAWSELHLTLAAGQIAETFLPCESLPKSTVFAHDWPEGQRLEVHESYHRWLASWQAHWKRGELLTIDYGGPPAEVYHRAPAGTLRAYHRHDRLVGPDLYSLPGRRDLTADVNFDDLVHHGEPLGLRTLSLHTQRDFLLPHLDPTQARPADRFLLDPAGAGSAFKVLRQARG